MTGRVHLSSKFTAINNGCLSYSQYPHYTKIRYLMFDNTKYERIHQMSSNIKCKLKHEISTMVICGAYMFKYNVSKDMNFF